MKKLCATIGVVCVAALLTGSAFGLEIQLAPQTLVLSSGGDQLTIHTDFPYLDAVSVNLYVGNTGVDVETWDDDCGNLDDVKPIVGDFDGRFTTVTVTLTVNSASASEILRVRK